MKASLRALLSNVIDYAGLFPPAKLPLDEAIRNYARYRKEPESWMLGRFICPATRLAELAPFVNELFTPESPLRLSVLGRGAETIPDSLDTAKADIQDMGIFEKQLGSQVAVDVYEVRTPPETQQTRGQNFKPLYLTTWGMAIRESGPITFFPFYEVELRNDWRSLLQEWGAGLAELQELANTEFERFEAAAPAAGLKLRCGGLDAAAFPPPELVAATITSCQQGRIPLKFTAGLHHPIRRFDPGVQTRMHGFLNVFVAGVLAHSRGLTEQQVRAIVEGEDSASFRFDDDGLSWKDYRASVAEIEKARQVVCSFGSCSFDEPRDDLRALGLL